MEVDVQLLPLGPPPETLSNRIVVVIDVLRATSVMVHAISRGAMEVIPAITVDEAFRLAKTFPAGTTLLGGERGSRKIPGFDLGNSPREYVAEKMGGKRLILTTTNGTRACHAVSGAGQILVASFFNIGAATQKCFGLRKDVLLFLSGDEGNFSFEDAVCGGMMVDHFIHKNGESIHLTDAASGVYFLYQQFKHNLVEAFRVSNHGKDLIAKGLEEDLTYCAQIDLTDVVPVFKEGVIRPTPTLSLPLGKGEDRRG
jgi:2-phosphosulfolactate phosphatase